MKNRAGELYRQGEITMSPGDAVDKRASVLAKESPEAIADSLESGTDWFPITVGDESMLLGSKHANSMIRIPYRNRPFLDIFYELSNTGEDRLVLKYPNRG